MARTRRIATRSGQRDSRRDRSAVLTAGRPADVEARLFGRCRHSGRLLPVPPPRSPLTPSRGSAGATAARGFPTRPATATMASPGHHETQRPVRLPILTRSGHSPCTRCPDAARQPPFDSGEARPGLPPPPAPATGPEIPMALAIRRASRARAQMALDASRPHPASHAPRQIDDASLTDRSSCNVLVCVIDTPGGRPAAIRSPTRHRPAGGEPGRQQRPRPVQPGADRANAQPSASRRPRMTSPAGRRGPPLRGTSPGAPERLRRSSAILWPRARSPIVSIDRRKLTFSSCPPPSRLSSRASRSAPPPQ